MKTRIVFILLITFSFYNFYGVDNIKFFLSNDKITAAIDEGNVNAFKSLLKNYDVNAADENGKSLLMHVSSAGSLKIMKFLFDKGANINALDKKGYTALVYAVEKGNYDAVKLLIDRGADINLSPKGRPLFIIACYSVSLDIMKLLIAKGADYKVKDKEGKNGLMTAASRQGKMEAEYLIGLGLDINAKDNNGNTALMMSVYADFNLEVVELLIKKGADVNAVNNKNKSVLDIALEYQDTVSVYNNDGIIQMLKDAGAKKRSGLKK